MRRLNLAETGIRAARVCWVFLACFAFLIFVLGIEPYYQAYLHLKSSGGYVAPHPAVWRTGLRQLHLSPTFYAIYNTAPKVLLAPPVLVLSTLIFIRNRKDWFSLLASFILVGMATVASGFGDAVVRAHPDWRLVNDLGGLLNFISFDGFLVLAFLFPNGRFVPKWTAAVALLLALISVGTAAWPGSGWDINTWPAVAAVSTYIVLFGSFLFAPIYRFIRVSDPVERQQTKWATVGILSAIIGIALPAIARALFPAVTGSPRATVLYDLSSQAVIGIGIMLLPICFAIAILRYRLWDIDVLINRALVYGSLTAAVLLLYGGAVVGLQTVFRPPTSPLPFRHWGSRRRFNPCGEEFKPSSTNAFTGTGMTP